MKLRLAVAGLLAAIFATAAIAAGLFPNFPIIGGASYCASYSTGVSGQVCTVSVPAGPTNLPGTAMVPMDTGLSQGQSPQTVLVPAALTGATTQDAAPLTGTTVAAGTGVAKLMLNPAGTIATLTVTLPAAANIVDGQTFSIYSSQTVTALTVTPGSGTTLTPTITTVTAAAPIKLVYVAATKAWQTF